MHASILKGSQQVAKHFAFQTPTSFLKPFPSDDLSSKQTNSWASCRQPVSAERPDRYLSSVMKAVSKATEIALDTEADSMHAYPEKVALDPDSNWRAKLASGPAVGSRSGSVDEGPLAENLAFSCRGLRPPFAFSALWSQTMQDFRYHVGLTDGRA